MKLKNIFVAITVTLLAIAIAAPADAQLKCKAKQDKKTGAIGYSFVNKAGGTVVYSYSDLDPSPGRPHYTNWGSFRQRKYLPGRRQGQELPGEQRRSRGRHRPCQLQDLHG